MVLAPYRAYDAELGRWISEDPIEEEGGVNLYGYVEGRSLNAWDPLGLDQAYSKSCVPASAAKAGSIATGKSISERKMRKAIDPDHDWDKHGTPVTNAVRALQSVGVSASVIPYSEINAALKKGPVIVVVRTSPTTTHAVVCTAQNPDGGYQIWNSDPPRGYGNVMSMTPRSILPEEPAVSVPNVPK